MSEYAVLAQNLVLKWAEPFEANDTPGKQLKRAYDRLRAKHMPAGWSKCWNAMYLKAGQPTYLALKEQERTVRNSQQVDARMRAQFINTMEMMRSTDEMFFRQQIKAYSALAGEGGRTASESDPAD